MLNFFLGPLLTWLPVIFFIAVFVLAVFLYFSKNTIFVKYSFIRKLLVLVIAVVVFRLLYALTLSVTQYYIWHSQEFTKLLLPPHQSINYFLFYSWGRFWMEHLIAFGAALVFCLFLKILRRYQERFLDKDEIIFGTLMVLLVGWPHAVVFVLLVFIVSVFVGFVFTFIFKNEHINLYPAFMVAGIITLIFGNTIVDISGLTVLRI